ncbi:outer membrane protein [Geofilum rubicundum JCM 15548]|uniref:Outer membrane protein n=2 Tax=Geofilum TaxID=1236988 RepID=A0A0E9LWX9_9BACT|nr:outer membrane protein [Geofilum rubicundum JCM 15548]
MDTLSLRFNLDFAWDAGVVNTDSVIKVALPDGPDRRWIRALFEKEGVEVSFMGNQVIIGKSQGQLPKSHVRTVTGTVVGAASDEPLAMVNVGVEGEPVGTTTNDLGQFSLKMPDAFVGKRMSFSYLGYVNSHMVIPAVDTTVVIRMKDYTVRLPEVQVHYRDPNQIVRAVRSSVEANYPSQRYLMTAFFRETIQQDDQFVDVSEAVIEILKPSYEARYDTERVRFVKGRKGMKTREMDVVQFKLVGGPYHFSQLDVMRQGDFLPNDKGQSAYKYTFDGVDIVYDRLVYRIGFRPYTDSGALFYEGEMRIEAESMALVSIDFQLTPAPFVAVEAT